MQTSRKPPRRLEPDSRREAKRLDGFDDTQRRGAEEQLREALNQAEAANAARESFLTNMSHELRTPLNAVSGMADLLAMEKLGARRHSLVTTIQASARELDRLIGGLLDLAKIDSGRLALMSGPFGLSAAVQDVFSACSLAAQSKALPISLKVDLDGADCVLGDEGRLKQMLSNLVSNAVKFTEAGEVEVLVRGRAIAGEVRLLISVRDTGIGFDAARKAEIFQLFHQGDESLTRRRGGVGVGLALTSRLAALMGGSIACDGSPGKGAIFTLSIALPLAPALVAEPPVRAAARAGHVLIVDDHPVNRQVAELILQAAGFTTECVEDGALAVQATEASRFDAILMDMQMPVMDGLTATRVIRRLETERGSARTPIIMLTANVADSHRDAALAAGADLHLPKSVTLPGLVRALNKLLDGDMARAPAPGEQVGAAG